jgi:hypothetical protein
MSTKLQDVANAALVYQTQTVQRMTQTITGSALDMLAGDGRCFAILNMGLFNATSLAVKFQESTTTTTTDFGDITGAAFATQTTTQTTPQMITFDRSKRYVRSIATFSGTTIDTALLVGEQLKQL